jgi:single-stranded-DNA-specific exonuclease
LLQRARDVAGIIKKAKEIHIVTHIDADGITAGAIAVQTLQRLHIPYSIECVKQLDDLILKRLANENHSLVWFTDLGSSISTCYPDINKVITDHHTCPEHSNLAFHFNPHLFGADGSYDMSGAGATYLVSKALDKNNTDLSCLAIVGACGDIQDKKYCCFTGTNKEIIADGENANVLKSRMDIRYFGRETRPLSKLLKFSNDPFIPGLSRREDACLKFLHQYNIRIKDKDYWRRWVDLEKHERKTIISGLAQILLTKGFGHESVKRLVGETVLLIKEKKATELHDAKEFATLLNSTARYGQYEVGLNVCLGNRDEYLQKARNLLRGHRTNLVQGLQFAREEEITKREFIQFFHAKDGIRDTIIGIVTNMLLSSEDIDSSLPLIGFAYTENGDVKVSARSTQMLIDKGLNLSTAIKKSSKELGGAGGGHDIAAGATIPKGKEEEFLVLIEKEIKSQLS